MPLSEEELRLLEQMERALVAEDPKLASTMRGTRMRANARRRSIAAAAVFVLGIVVLMAGAVSQLTVVGIVGFVLMLASAYVGLSSWRGAAAQDETVPETGGDAAFSVIDGGRAKKKAPRSRTKKSASNQSMMDRFEERWRRRRDQNGM